MDFMSIEQQPMSRLEGITATRFDECSIAAADACKSANALMDNYRYSHVIGLGELVILWEESMADATPKPEECIELSTASGANSEKYKLIRRHDSGVTYLLGVVSTNLCLPVASFHERPGSMCSYVQLGQEMYDSSDNFVIGPKEQRLPIVESIRWLLERNKNNCINENTGFTVGAAALNVHFKKEKTKDQYREIILEKENQCFAWELHRKFSRRTSTTEKLWFSGKNEYYQTELKTVPLSSPILPERTIPRPVRLMLAKSDEQAAPLRLLAVTRKDVAETLATIHANGEWEFPEALTTRTSKTELARLFYNAICEEELLATTSSISYRGAKKDRDIAKYRNFLKLYTAGAEHNSEYDLLKFLENYYQEGKKYSRLRGGSAYHYLEPKKGYRLPSSGQLGDIICSLLNAGSFTSRYHFSKWESDELRTAAKDDSTYVPNKLMAHLRRFRHGQNIIPAPNRKLDSLFLLFDTSLLFMSLGRYDPDTESLWQNITSLQERTKKKPYNASGTMQTNINGSPTTLQLTYTQTASRPGIAVISVKGRPEALINSNDEAYYDVLFDKTKQPINRVTGEVLSSRDIRELLEIQVILSKKSK